jgi:CUB domain
LLHLFQVIKLDFDSFNTESCCDFVNVHDGDSAKSTKIRSLSGSYVGSPASGIISTQQYMFVRFLTDSTNTFGGFSAKYASGRC